MKQISGFENVDWTGVRVKKINRTARAIVGTVQILKPKLDNDVKVEVQLFKKQGGEYRKLPYNFPRASFCDAVNNDVYLYPDFVEQTDFTRPMPCPVEKVCYLTFFKKNSNGIFRIF
jgi:hypothetical protein